jgi:putative phage-type endonuclease
MPETCVTQRTPEWFAARRGKITASLAAACLRLDPGKSAQKAWREITGWEPEQFEHRALQWGVQFEAAARLDYEAESGNIVETCGFFVHPEHPWLGASPDGLVGSDGLAEIKCPTVPPVTLPRHHRVQCMVQLAVTGRQWCDIYFWGASGHKTSFAVDRRGIPGLIHRLHAFYLEYVQSGIEPPRKKPKRKRK